MAEKLLELEARLLGELNQDTQELHLPRLKDTRVAVGIKVSAAKPEFDFSGWSNEQIAQREHGWNDIPGPSTCSAVR